MRKVKNLAVVCTMLLASTFLLGNKEAFKAEKTENDTIRDGVYIGGISVGGMSEKEATTAIENYLVRGAKRSEDMTYPNREWGYGILDLYETFLNLRG